MSGFRAADKNRSRDGSHHDDDKHGRQMMELVSREIRRSWTSLAFGVTPYSEAKQSVDHSVFKRILKLNVPAGGRLF